MSIQQFLDNSDRLINLIDNFTNEHIEKTGDTADTCQNTAIKLATINLSSALNDVEADDMKLPKADHERAFVQFTPAQLAALLKATHHTMTNNHARGVLTDQEMLEAQAAETILNLSLDS